MSQTELSLKIHQLKALNPGLGYHRIASLAGCSRSLVRHYLASSFQSKRRNRQARNRKINISSLKITHGGCCRVCGYKKTLAALDFHHPDPALKTGSISVLIRTNKAKAIAEANKCILMCRNCHVEEHEKMLEMEPRTGIEPAV